MGAAEGTFDFDLELKKRSSLATILDKNYTLNWIPTLMLLVSEAMLQKQLHRMILKPAMIQPDLLNA